MAAICLNKVLVFCYTGRLVFSKALNTQITLRQSNEQDQKMSMALNVSNKHNRYGMCLHCVACADIANCKLQFLNK